MSELCFRGWASSNHRQRRESSQDLSQCSALATKTSSYILEGLLDGIVNHDVFGIPMFSSEEKHNVGQIMTWSYRAQVLTS